VDKRRIYVVDGGNHRVAVYDKQGKFLFSIGREGIEDGEFRGPVGIDVDRDGMIYVADAGNFRIQIFNSKGRFAGQIPLARDGVRIRPVDVAADTREGLLFVTGSNVHRVLSYTLRGRFRKEWGGNGVEEGQFRYPATIKVMDDSRLAVVDVLNTRIQLFTQKGGFSLEVGEWGVLPGQLFRPKGVAINSKGQFFVSDSYMNLVQVYESTGQFLYVLGKGGKPYKLNTAAGLAIDERDRLYVARMLDNKVSVFQVAPK
jgi:DNA-binding beta-propeller fold protein YncE